MSRKKMAAHLNISVYGVKNFMAKNNLRISKGESRKLASISLSNKTSFTSKEDNFIKENYLILPVKTIAAQLERSGYGIRWRLNKLGLVIPKEIIEQRKQESYYKKGSTPANKGLKQTEYMSAEQIEKTKPTHFKKGHLPHNAIGVKNGDLRIRTNHKDRNGRQYKWIRISLGHWEMLHIYNWEQLNGTKPKGSILRFIDNDSMNCDPANLQLIDMRTNMALNTIHRYPDELKRLIKLNSKLFKITQNARRNQE